MENLKANTRKTNAEATITEDVGLDQAKATLNQTLQNTGLTAAQIQKVNAETENAIAQLQNIKDENLKIKRAAELLYQQANLASQQQLSETQKYEVLKAQAKLIVAQTGLANLDIQAANALDNLGRTSQQLKPIVDMLRVFLRK
jgi:HSP90 family molecular chaperone